MSYYSSTTAVLRIFSGLSQDLKCAGYPLGDVENSMLGSLAFTSNGKGLDGTIYCITFTSYVYLYIMQVNLNPLCQTTLT